MILYECTVKTLEKKIDELNEYKEQYFDYRDKLIKAEEKIRNQQQAIDTTRKTLERLTEENKALKALVKLWA